MDLCLSAEPGQLKARINGQERNGASRSLQFAFDVSRPAITIFEYWFLIKMPNQGIL